ncbi:MAG: hypothetical protein HZA51_04210 [Planctomycetes bacterium]|nr:hypothetical protein [Planctomycetota bacterium]
MTQPTPSTRRKLVTAGVLGAAYLGLFVAADFLQFPIRKDERFFWPVVEQFAASFPPPIALLRDYDSPTTPLLFVVLGAVEHVIGGGIATARAVCLACSLIIAMIVAWPRSDSWSRPALALIGLAACPYFLGTSIHVYTDILASLFGVLGMIGFLNGRHVVAALSFALAIATRQYMVAFPLAMISTTVMDAARGRKLERGHVIAYSTAALTLAMWVVFFGGLAPAMSRQSHLSADASGHWHVDHSLYFLSCIGAYFVLIEMLLFRKRFSFAAPARALKTATAIAILFLICPPMGNAPGAGVEAMGYLDKGLRFLLPDVGRVAVLAVLALLGVQRFAHNRVQLALILIQALTLVRSHIAWDKYALPVLVILWYFRARNDPISGSRAGTIKV